MKLLTKSVVVATVLCFVAGLSAGAAVSSYSPGAGDLFAGENLFALPVVPTDLDGSGNGPGYPEWILAGFDLTGTNLQRWDAATQAMLSRGDAGFGNLLSTDGYWLNAVDSTPFTFNGADDLQQTDYWISLPKTGTTVVGNPYLYSVDWNKISVTNGMETVSIDAAIDTKGWLTEVVGFDNSFKSNVPVGPGDTMPVSTSDLAGTKLEPWRGYRITSLVDNLALIVTARKATDNVFAVKGTISVGGIPVPASPIIVELRDGGGAKLMRTIKHVGSAGEYALDGVAPGTYTVAFKGANTLAKVYGGVTVTSADVTLNVDLIGGDIDGDNYVGGSDFDVWNGSYDTVPGDASWDARADIDGDGYVGSSDFDVWNGNYDLVGDETW